MKKVELLAPAGSFDALKAAVQNGCDAVYLGGSAFGARAYADNFDDASMHDAIAYAHTYGVRVFVTMNTLIQDEEMTLAIAQAQRLQAMDVDAVIIQDMGLFQCLRTILPDLELHVSTQMHIHNEQGIRYLKETGATRIVLPRETPLEQIKQYAKEGIDLEVFVQGALCISYSGQCLMSAKTLQRSGNRGACAQSCRMQYTLEKEEHGTYQVIDTKGRYLLSPKDLNTLAHVPAMIRSGIASFKIEGRMKRPEYVALMCACYRQAIDAYYEGRDFHVDQCMQREMEMIFHRGFTSGLLFHQQGSALMNTLRPNHMGVEIGKVISVHNNRMRIQLSDDLYQGDGIRVINKEVDEGFRANMIYHNGLLVNHAGADDCIELKKTGFITQGASIVKTSDGRQLEALRKTFTQYQRKIVLHAYFYMHAHTNAILTLYDEVGHQVTITSEAVVEKALKTALDEERILTQLKKSGNTPFTIQEITVDMEDDVTFPIRELNQMRRDALAMLSSKREIMNKERRVLQEHHACAQAGQNLGILCVVHTKEQFNACLACGIHYIFVEQQTLYRQLMKQGHQVYQRTPRIMKAEYQEQLELVNEYGALFQQHKGSPYICDTSLNVTNAHTAAVLFSQAATCVTLSYELSVSQALHLVKQFELAYHHQGAFALPVYGRMELMISEYCPIHTAIADRDKANCQLCRGDARYALVDLKKHRYPLLNDEYCRMRLYDEKPIDRIDEIAVLNAGHIHNLLCTFSVESAQEVKQVLKRIQAHAA